ncbi:RAD51-associated protein 1-like isoform X2 [Dreissena polymorpha]|uniref:RAD51-associated protein 1-like isoform X2 n=1 Tax=Dreissena polymorpha TaxID=45954 RepID=UPI0022649A67|nr:RAD51-associated protein 1-like isoform X2 [Dreissena polymorpha]
MPERKSDRARKVVDYGKFGGGDSDDDFDDDFKECTPPVAKKPKIAIKENKQKSTDKIPKNKSRKSVEEKIYERELQAALELSMSQSDQSQGCGTHDKGTADNSLSDDLPPVLDQEATSPVIPPLGNIEKDPPPVTPRLQPANQHDSDDDIQVIETGIEAVPSSSRKRSTKARKYVDSDSDEGEDSDYEAEDALQDEEDDDSDKDYNGDGSDSDFGSKKKKANVKGKQTKSAPQKDKSVNKKQQNAGKSAKQPSSSSKSKSLVPKSSKVEASSPLATSSPLVSRTPTSCRTSTPTTTVRLQQTWKPPGAATANSSPSVGSIKSQTSVGKSPGLEGVHIKLPCLGGVNIKSPSSGLRLGLSRNMKSKPLHPNLKIAN